MCQAEAISISIYYQVVLGCYLQEFIVIELRVESAKVGFACLVGWVVGVGGEYARKSDGMDLAGKATMLNLLS